MTGPNQEPSASSDEHHAAEETAHDAVEPDQAVKDMSAEFLKSDEPTGSA